MAEISNNMENTGDPLYQSKNIAFISFYLSLTQFIFSPKEPKGENKYMGEVRKDNFKQQQQPKNELQTMNLKLILRFLKIL